jgi:acetyl esterase/lipase
LDAPFWTLILILCGDSIDVDLLVDGGGDGDYERRWMIAEENEDGGRVVVYLWGGGWGL